MIPDRDPFFILKPFLDNLFTDTLPLPKGEGVALEQADSLNAPSHRSPRPRISPHHDR